MRTVIVVTLGRSGRVASNETLSQRQRRLAEEADVNGEGYLDCGFERRPRNEHPPTFTRGSIS